jgi:cytoplasmic iron level regulating protein YaaA (DUF328/UPF0246 family)
MLIVISPAKTLDFESPLATETFSQPQFLDDSQQLIDELRHLTAPQVSSLMKISDKLGELNLHRFQSWQRPFNPDNARQAILAFKGDVYTGMAAGNFSEADFTFAQTHLRMLSGLYGILRPLDLMQAYRLEMGTGFANRRGKNLYQFWGDKLTEHLNAEPALADGVLINLASNEYFGAVNTRLINAEVFTPIFKDAKNGQYKIISFFAKKARGLMSAWIIQNRITRVEDLKQFTVAGYRFDAASSSARDWVFLRDEAGDH